MSAPLWFSASWDDGHPLDARVAELFAKHACAATFYVPMRNREGLPVLDAAALRALDGRFEIAAHTLDHVPLATVDDTEARRQIEHGKQALEDTLGHAVAGFCYPQGRFRAVHAGMARAAGFAYARTIVNFDTGLADDPFLMPTTAQFYPHGAGVLLRNWLRHGHWARRARACARLAGHGLEAGLERLLVDLARRGGVLHVWGHSWELERLGAWDALDRFLAAVARVVPPERRVDNARLAALSLQSK
jgi:peptidoglycan/xylan/chitin deacetylase (PgdA/CDA1 family)